jgi:cell division septal protein FtsQ
MSLNKKIKNKNFFYFCFFFILITTIFLILQSKYLTIKKITIQFESDKNFYQISENQILKEVEELLKGKTLLIFPKNTLFTLPKKEIKNKLLQIKEIKIVKIEKKWPNQLIINLFENEPLAIISILGDKNYFLGSNLELILDQFNILRRLNLALPIIYDKTKIPLEREKLIEIYKKAYYLAKEKFKDDIFFKEIEINTDSGVIEFKALSNENWIAYFVPLENFNQQIENLKLVLKNYFKEKEKRKDLKYIDLRFENRIYYK